MATSVADRLRWALDLSDFVTVPLATGAALLATPSVGPSTICGLAAGAIGWTMIEYGVHRALHAKRLPVFTQAHAILRRAHIRHHQHPVDLPGGTLWSSLIILVLIVVAICCPALASAVAGLLAGYFVFLVLHHGEHHGWDLSAVGHLAERRDFDGPTLSCA